MVYVIKQYRSESGMVSSMLHEMTKREFSRCVNTDSVEFYTVSAAKAHRHVKAGYIHSTRLWVDDSGRVRKA